MSDFELMADIVKLDDDQHLVFGWLSVSQDADGNLVVDHQGDIIMPDELERMAYNFVLHSRQAGEMHMRAEGVGQMVESMVFTREKVEALGLPDNALPTGWWVGFLITDEDVWQQVKDGTYSMFSIGGTADREEVDDLDDIYSQL